MDSNTTVKFVTVEESMQAMSEIIRHIAYQISFQLEILIHDECRKERKLLNGLSDLMEQLEVVKEELTVTDRFETRASVLREVVQRYRSGSNPVDTLRRNLEGSLYEDYGLLRLSDADETAE